MTEAKEAIGDKIIELEEKAQYQEANARLSASMLSTENMDLKEKTRKLGIQLCKCAHPSMQTLARNGSQAFAPPAYYMAQRQVHCLSHLYFMYFCMRHTK